MHDICYIKSNCIRLVLEGELGVTLSHLIISLMFLRNVLSDLMLGQANMLPEHTLINF